MLEHQQCAPGYGTKFWYTLFAFIFARNYSTMADDTITLGGIVQGLVSPKSETAPNEILCKPGPNLK